MEDRDLFNNSKRFLDAYNNIDYALKRRYDFHRSMGFSDLIRKTASLNYIVRKYEDCLIDYGRLRNAIVHNNNEDFVIAEPHNSVVENIEHIEKLITTPPRALDSVAIRDVLTVPAGKSMRDVIMLMSSSGYSNLPVYKNGALIGVANGQKIINSMGQYLLSGGKPMTFLDNVQIEDMLSSIENTNYYCVKKEDCTVEDALEEFNSNHKLLAILFTKRGTTNELPVGIMTASNIVEAQNVIENY